MTQHRFILLLLCTFWCGLTISAAGGRGYAVIELSGGGGLSNMGVTAAANDQHNLKIKSLSSYTYTGHIGLAYMINPYIGLGVGADFTRIGGGVGLTGNMRWDNVGDTERERYNHIAVLNDWKEQQQMLLVEIPIGLRFGAAVGSAVEFTGEAGLRIGLPIQTDNDLAGSVTHQGEYDPWALLLNRVDNHGFYTADFAAQPAISARTSYSLYAKLGIQTPIKDDVVWFYSQVYGAYALTNALALGDLDLGFRNDNMGQDDAHAFMADYSSAYDTRYIAKVRPFQLGLEVGLRFFLFPKQHFPCHCVKDRF